MLSLPDPVSEGSSEQLKTFLGSVQDKQVRTSSDRELAKRISGAVQHADLELGGLSVYVHDGSVAVYGKVTSDVKREALLSLIAEQPGAKSVVDHMVFPEN